jgi:hypothetical protein
VDVQSLGDCGILIPSTDTKEKMMTEFAPRPVNVNGMSLTAYVDGVTMASVVARFGEGLMIGYGDDEKGYDGREVGFVHLPLASSSASTHGGMLSEWAVARMRGRMLCASPRNSPSTSDMP